jgi:hypothetical protein
MDWMQIIWAVAIGAMIIMFLPRAKYMVENSPKGNMKDWMGFILPIFAIVLFVILLIALV